MVRFVERDHPRWPAKTPGSKGGEFRDASPGVGKTDWADRLSGMVDTRPAGRHGSVATGITQRCPVCGRTVKVVGAGKLSTHNNPQTGRRCTGSGLAATVEVPEGVQRAPGIRTPAKKATARKAKPPGRPPPGPQVTYGSPLQPVDDPEARARLEQWRYGATTLDSDAGRQAKIHQARHDIRSWEQNLERERYKARRKLAQIYLGRQPWDYISPSETNQYADEADRDATVRYYTANLASRRADLQDLIDAGPSGFDPANPLAYYGDMLHVESSDWFTYEALDELEQQIPPVFHRVVAEYLRDQQRSVPEAGIYIGSTHNIRDLDNLQRKITTPPRGWGKDATMATWERVDGVVSSKAIYAVVHTNNSEDHRASRRAALRRADIWDARPTGSASLHEFGHLLDAALGFYENQYRTRPSNASEQRRWRLVHGEVKREAQWLSPYFRQKGDAGPEEFWADAFYTWGAVAPEPWAGQSNLIEFRNSKRRLTRRDIYMAEHYGLPMRTAVKVVDYFDRLEREVTTGKRLPTIEQISASL